MDNAGRVRGNECRGDLYSDVEYFDQFESLTQMLSEGDAIDELGGDESGIIRAANFIDSENVWMIKSGCSFRFLDESVYPTLMRGEFGCEEFQSHRTAKLSILRPVYFTHSSRTDFADDAISRQGSSGG